MATLEWGVVGVLYSLSRTDPNVLDQWSPNVFADQYPNTGLVGAPYATLADAIAAFAALSPTYLGTYLPYIPERISYPGVFGGPREIYLPDYSPSFTEYPFTVQAYSLSFTAFRGLDSPLYYTTLIIASGLSRGDVIPPPAPGPVPDVTIQLKRDNTIGKYSVKPSDATVLVKYQAPVTTIRAKFDTTRIAIIEETLDGGFMIYEEVGAVAITPVYIYNGNRRLVEVIDAAYIPLYRAV